LPDEEIIRRFQETGDGECFAELFVRYRKQVYCACRGFFNDGAAAEDATQETFLRIYRRARLPGRGFLRLADADWPQRLYR